MGRGVRRQNLAKARSYFWTSFAFLFTLYSSLSAILLFFGATGHEFLNYGSQSVILASFLLLLSISGLLSSMFVALIRTFPYFISVIAGNLLKLAVGISLVLLGYGWVGALLGYAINSVVIDAFGILYSRVIDHYVTLFTLIFIYSMLLPIMSLGSTLLISVPSKSLSNETI